MALPVLLTFAVLFLASVPTPHAAESPAEAYWIKKLGKNVTMPKLLKDVLADFIISNADGKGVMTNQGHSKRTDQFFVIYGKGYPTGTDKTWGYGSAADMKMKDGQLTDTAHFGYAKAAQLVDTAHVGWYYGVAYRKAAQPADTAHFGHGKTAQPADTAHFGYKKTAQPADTQTAGTNQFARPLGYGKAARPTTTSMTQDGKTIQHTMSNFGYGGTERFGYGDSAHPAKNTDSHAENFVVYFFEKDLHPGNKMKLHFMKSKDHAKFIPVEMAKSMPFSSNKWSEILKLFSVKPQSDVAKTMKETIDACEGKMSIKGEDKVCTNSLESMIDYVTSHLGNKVEALSTYINKETEKEYTIESAETVGNENANLVCHKMGYPYAVFYCHSLKKTNIYRVTLVDAEGNKVKAAAACHKDTSKWNPKHFSFVYLNIKPGTVPVCHILTEKAVAWVRKSQVM